MKTIKKETKTIKAAKTIFAKGDNSKKKILFIVSNLAIDFY